MALTQNYPLNEMPVQAEMADISTAGSAYAVAPRNGRIVRVYSILKATITVADAVWTMKINGVAVPGVSVTIAAAASAAGTVDTAITSISVVEGDTIEFVSDGGSTSAASATFTAIIREG